MTNKKMKVSDIIKRDNNNFDIIRITAALLVIYGHSYALTNSSEVDLIRRIVGFDYAGSIAVKIFFFLSGLLVTNSIITNNDIFKYSLSRVFRIFPALIACLFITSFILGPLMTNLSLYEYLTSSEPFKYFINNTILKSNYFLPGVFDDHRYTSVNGSIWTIPYEVSCYITLAFISLIGLLNNKKLSLFIYVVIILDLINNGEYIYSWVNGNHEVISLGFCFATGSIFAIHKENIDINISILIASWLLFYSLVDSSINFIFFYVAVFISVLYLSSLSIVKKIKMHGDYSYGVYLWGWPVQQIFIYLMPLSSPLVNFSISSVVAVSIGAISWYLIEKPMMNINKIINNGRYAYSK